MIVAMDGPSGVGKSTVTEEVARRLGLSVLDTGALYRGAALLAKQTDTDWEDGPAVARLIEEADFHFETIDSEQKLFLGDLDISKAIRTPEISEGASLVSAQPAVRAALLDLQRRLGRRSDCIVEGRDIGTVVFPDADHKFFLTASLDERIRRRRLQYLEQGKEVSNEALVKEVTERDQRDATRRVAPLVQAEDAVLVDSTRMSFEEVVQFIVETIRPHPDPGEAGVS